MSNRTKFAVGGVVVGLVAWWLLPWYVGLLIILVALGLPLAGYLMLDPSQRRRLRRVSRKQLDR